jgi:hypothetical protein
VYIFLGSSVYYSSLYEFKAGIAQSVNRLGYRLDDRVSSRGSIPGKGNFFFPIMSRPALGSAKLPTQWIAGDVPLGVKRKRHEAHHSLPSGVEVKKDGAAPPLPHRSP